MWNFRPSSVCINRRALCFYGYEELRANRNGRRFGGRGEAKYLKEGLEVIVGLYDGRPVSIQLPKKIQYKVAEAPPAVKGDSASGNVTKEIVLDNGLKFRRRSLLKKVKKFWSNTETGDYSARVVIKSESTNFIRINECPNTANL